MAVSRFVNALNSRWSYMQNGLYFAVYIYISRHMVACHATQEVSESHHEYIDKNNNAIFTHVQLHAAYETIQF